MKTWLPDTIAIDTLFRDKLEELPVDLNGKALHWQVVKQQMQATPAKANVGGTAISHITGYVIVGLLIVIVSVQQVMVHYKPAPPQQGAKPPALPQAGDTVKASDAIQHSTGHTGRDIALSVPTAPVPGKQLNPIPKAAYVPADSLPPVHTVISPIFTAPDTQAKAPAIRKDSVSRSVKEKMKKDSVFIFW